MVVIERAKSNRALCYTCHKIMKKDVIKIGIAYKSWKYLHVHFHHEDCFWNTQAKTYYIRGGKQTNNLLKLEQFSGRDCLDQDEKEDLNVKILQSNLKMGTAKAFENAGMEIPVDKIVAEPLKASKKRKKAQTHEIENENAKEDKPKSNKRSKKQKNSISTEVITTVNNIEIEHTQQGEEELVETYVEVHSIV